MTPEQNRRRHLPDDKPLCQHLMPFTHLRGDAGWPVRYHWLAGEWRPCGDTPIPYRTP